MCYMDHKDNPMTALVPPVEWAHLRWHWLRNGEHAIVSEWRDKSWTLPTSSVPFSPDDMAAHHWRYHGPCDPAAITPNPDDPAQVEAVARGFEGPHGIFARRNKDLDGPQWEICRYGMPGEEEIVIIEVATHLTFEARVADLRLEALARAALTALRDMGRPG